MSGLFWIALELENPAMGLNTRFSLMIMKYGASKFDGVATAGNTAWNEESFLFITM